MLYELRVYHCMPGKLPAVVKRFDTATVALFEKHGIRQVGFWTVAIGESNADLHYILKWDSLDEREKKFATFQAVPQDCRARQERGGRSANRVVQQFDSHANQVFRAQIGDVRSAVVRG